MPLTVAYKNAMLDGSAMPPAYLSLHTAAPGSTGANEVSGGSPAYARKEATWAAATGGAKALSAPVTFDVPPNTTVAYIGFWTMVTGGVFLGYHDVSDEVYGSQGGQATIPAGGTIDLNATASA